MTSVDNGVSVPYTSRGPRLYYERQGSGEPLLCITGFAISAAVFEPVVPQLAEHFDVITYDQRWSGRSSSPLRPTSMPELAADATKLLDDLGVESAHVLGVSFGGMVAQELAIRFPERVRGLVLAGATPGGPLAVLPNLAELFTILAESVRGLPREAPPWLGAFVFSPEYRSRHPDRVRELARLFVRHLPPPWGLAAHWWASVYHDTVSRLDRIQAPTLVMHGECDGMAPLGLARLLAARIPDAELVVFPEAGHAFPLEVPDQTLDTCLDWLAERGAIAPGSPREGLAPRIEPITRALGLPVGALRTGRSLIEASVGLLRGDNGVDRRRIATRSAGGGGSSRTTGDTARRSRQRPR